MASSASTLAAPPEVEATLSRLVGYKNVQGVLILSRPNGIILRSAGPLFAHAPARPSRTREEQVTRAPPPTGEENPEGEATLTAEEDGAEDVPTPAHSELARKYARAASRIVDCARSEVRDVDEEADEDVRFLRVRTKRHELMITPDPQYVLVVVQDPTN
ncbi:hypothetical protein BMF94_1720 [Rhodotorula taiwanensis]|uniref:Roadblock/LAMTOR2 domain-containing protein n=1 Tax=Rhodotorula taiwanensis TaxID=741276 RepID=A0A2S5BEA3_9BASI|nr:hypothetical protein BMF94_1720 [Rhodotorula taiwanensis]